MVISRIYGGLGNQLFQYAIGKKIALLRGTELKLDIFDFDKYKLRNYELNKFNIKAEIASTSDVKNHRIDNKILDRLSWKLSNMGLKYDFEKYYEKKDYKFDQAILNNSKIKYLQGYWQSYKYFESVRNILLKEFTLQEDVKGGNVQILEKIKFSSSVSVHIRRGDYLKNSIYYSIPIKYYRNAIEYIEKQVENPVFYVFSDDLSWVRQNIRMDVNMVYVDINDGNSAEFDLELMKNCKHNIIANSSFSWWGAWLNQNENKIVISPNKWVSYIDNLDDLLPSRWIRKNI